MRRVLRYARFALWAMRVLVPSPVVGDAPAVVGMASFAPRVNTVWLAIESIGRGSSRPTRLMLWLDQELESTRLPLLLRLQKRRGLEILFAENIRSFKKIYPYSHTGRTDRLPYVTADDDVIYPSDWLAELIAANASAPGLVHGHRGRKIIQSNGKIAPYDEWPKCQSDQPSFNVFLTGVSGIIYPPEFLDLVAAAGDAFLRLSPTADDLWLHHIAVRNAIRHHQISTECREFETVPRSQAVSLAQVNVDKFENDRQFDNLYDANDRRAILLDEVSRSATTAEE